MKEIAVTHELRARLRGPIPAALLAAVALALLVDATAAQAASPYRADGTIVGCYKVRGKPKGSVRVLSGGRHCMRGERRLTFSPGSPGTPGAPGADADEDSVSADPDTAALEARITSLGLEVQALQGTLSSLTATLDGISRAELLGALGSPLVLESLCGELPAVVDQSNLHRTSLLDLTGILGGTVLGPIFGPLSISDPLAPYQCPEP